MLNAISEEGRGQSMYIEDAESIPSAFASALGALMSMAAQNLELIFMPEEGVSICRVETSFRKVTQSDGSIQITIGDMFADEQKDFLVEVQLPHSVLADHHQPVMHVQARYVDVNNTCLRHVGFDVSILRTLQSAGLRTSHPTVLVSSFSQSAIQVACASVC